MKITAIGINARFTHSCLALFVIREVLERRLSGGAVTIRQFTINDPSYQVVQELADDRSDYLFFSAAIWNSALLEQLIDDLLALSGGRPIVVGGPQADVIGARFADNPWVTIFSGAIEAAGSDFFDDLVYQRLQQRYAASFFRQPDRWLPFPYRPEDFTGPLRNRAIYYESSRGCPFSCTYCLSSAETGLYHKGLDQVAAELSMILAHRPKIVRFVDRTFNDRPERALAIWQLLAAYDGPTRFHFELAPDRFTEEMFAFLETIGPARFQFEIGLQSTHHPTLAAIRRPTDPVIAAATIRRLRQLETIHLHVDLILGLPEETPASFARSLNDVFAMSPHYIQMGLLKILPGTEMATAAQRQGYRFSSHPPYPVFATAWMTGDQLRDFYRLGECLERFVNNRYFVSFWRYLVLVDEDMAAFFGGLSRLFQNRGYCFMATTQETLSSLLVEYLHGRADGALCHELLCYDWLRCGHRFLPDHLLQGAGESLEELRRHLYQRLPQSLPGLFAPEERNHFIKKCVFHRFSGPAMQAAGLTADDASAVVCFSPHREETVFALQKTAVVTISD